LLAAARQRNEAAGVTGVLLHHDGSFFQYLEGPAQGLAPIFKIIRASRLHRGLVELLDQPVRSRLFPEWLMGFCEAPVSSLQQLEQARWGDAVERLQRREDQVQLDGAGLLLDFWHRCSHNQG
jgi:hypothetical protein